MTLADQAAIAGHDGQMGGSGRPQRRTFTAAYKAKILAEYEQAGPGERGAILRREAVTTGHISDWRKTRDKGGRKELAPKPAGRPGRSAQEVENERLRSENEKLTAELARTKAALEVVGKAAMPPCPSVTTCTRWSSVTMLSAWKPICTATLPIVASTWLTCVVSFSASRPPKSVTSSLALCPSDHM